MPIELEISLTNKGIRPLEYWCGGPGIYPQASSLRAVFSDSNGAQLVFPLSNGQVEEGSGVLRSIAIGQLITIPAAMEPLPPGTYTLVEIIREGPRYPSPPRYEYFSWPGIRGRVSQPIIVEHGDEAAHDAEKSLLTRIRANDPFAQHVGLRLGDGVKYVVQSLIADLQSPETETVSNAAMALMHLRSKPPPELGPTIERATTRLLNADPIPWDCLGLLCYLAAWDGSDASLKAVISCLDAPTALGGHADLIFRLQEFKQPLAHATLRKFLTLDDRDWRFNAAWALSEQRELTALEELLKYLNDPQNADRVRAFTPLEAYFDDPRVIALIESFTNSSDQNLRDAAVRSRQELRRRAAERESSTRSALK
jgi:hypothetical protein